MGCSARAFTLIELLVVVTMIVVLLALLAPTLDKAVDAAQDVACGSNLHQTGVGLTSFAIDRKARLPDGQPVLGGVGIYSVWESAASSPRYTPDQEFGRFRGHGRTGMLRYTEPKLFYCAANWHPNIQYGKAGHQVQIAGQILDAPEKVGGWPTNNDPEGEGYLFVWTAYHYRSSFDGPPGKWRAATLRRDPGHEPIMADAFSDPSRSVDHHHQRGYNVLTIGGHVSFHEDPDRVIVGLNGAETYQTNYPLQKIVWEQHFGRP